MFIDKIAILEDKKKKPKEKGCYPLTLTQWTNLWES
jgi:hypothetical protein